VRFTPLTGTIGADVHGIDLSQPLDGPTVREIRDGLLDHLVLIFREQAVLTVEQHRRLCRYFGELEIAPFLPENAPDRTLLVLDQMESRGSQAANFHADNTFRPHPPLGAILQAHVVPEDGGGDTCFASMYAAWEALSPRMQAHLDGLEAWHSLEQMTKRLAAQGLNPSQNLADFPPIRHPVVAVHPETGRKLLNVNYNWTTEIADIPPAESRMLLDFLYAHIRNPEFQVRLHWRPGDVAFWDNRATQHYAVPDYRGRRLMQRIAIAGSPQMAVA
jgi:taurine dioxygenase